MDTTGGAVPAGHRRFSRTPEGRALIGQHAEAVSIELGALLERLFEDPSQAGPHHAAWPLLLDVTGRGPRSLALIALSAAIDGLPGASPVVELHARIGSALKSEMLASRAWRSDAGLARLVTRAMGERAIADPVVLRECRVDPSGWTRAQRMEVGALAFDAVQRGAGLFSLALTRHMNKNVLMAVPAAAPAGAQPKARAPSMPNKSPLPTWLLDNRVCGDSAVAPGGRGVPLIRHKASQGGASPSRPSQALVFAANRLQEVATTVDPWMLGVMQQAWEQGIPGLFPVCRHAEDPPPPPGGAVGAAAMAAWRLARYRAQSDARQGKRDRKRIEAFLEQARQFAGRSMWQPHFSDFRGRLYTEARTLTHQGPDWAKGAIGFQLASVPSTPGWREWILQSAANHYGKSGTIQAMREWGRNEAGRLMAVAEDPLGRLELWRGAKDPWQFLQACRALATGDAGAPVRLDQCNSGAAIAAALTRDHRLARLTNLVARCQAGEEERLDLYSRVVDVVVDALQEDLHFGGEGTVRLARFWLERGITRRMAKPLVVASLYGGSHLSSLDAIALELAQEQMGQVARWRGSCVTPAQYLAKKFRLAIRRELEPVHAIRGWVRALAAARIRQGQPFSWATPSGVVVAVGRPDDGRTAVHTYTTGSARWATGDDVPLEGELSLRATGPGLMPNFIHSFEAAFLHLVVSTAAGEGIPLLANHDCFATPAGRADALHDLLHSKMREVYAGDHLVRIWSEVVAATGVKAVPAPPCSGTLDSESIGLNPHHFC